MQQAASRGAGYDIQSPKEEYNFDKEFWREGGTLDDTGYLIWNSVLSEMDETLRNGVLMEWDIDGIEGLWWM